MAARGDDLRHGAQYRPAGNLDHVAQGTPPARAEQGASPEAQELELRRERLLGMRVSHILDAHEDALQALIDGGFSPLSNPVARLAMAHTVNLAQAFRIRGQGEAEQEALIQRLLELAVDRSAK